MPVPARGLSQVSGAGRLAAAQAEGRAGARAVTELVRSARVVGGPPPPPPPAAAGVAAAGGDAWFLASCCGVGAAGPEAEGIPKLKVGGADDGA